MFIDMPFNINLPIPLTFSISRGSHFSIFKSPHLDLQYIYSISGIHSSHNNKVNAIGYKYLHSQPCHG